MAAHHNQNRRAFDPAGSERKPPTVIPGLGVDLPELQSARALWQRNRFDEAVGLFEQTARKYPQNLVALVDASRALGARFEITRAEAIIDRMMKVAARRAEVMHLAGQSYRMIFRPEKAIACFQRVLAMTKTIPDAYLELAILYERRHRLAEALAVIEECLQREPDYLEAALIKARLLRRAGEPAAAETLFRDLAKNDGAHPHVRAQAWSEVAQVLDKEGDFEEAMQAMLRCKKILLAEEAAPLEESNAVLSHLRTLADSLRPEHFRRWEETGNAHFQPRKMAVLCGFPRSGTTLLEQVLDSHSGLISSDEREAFARDIFPAMWQTAQNPLPNASILDGISIEKLAAQRTRYLAYMEAALNEPIGGRVHLDKNPSLTLLIPAMLRLFPETKLLIALRDPRDLVISCFMQYLPLNANSVCFLTLERTAQRYAHDLQIWRNFREIIGSQWLETKYEDTVADLEKEARRTLGFLGLPWEAGVLAYRDRLKHKAVNSPTYEAVSQPLYTRAIGRWRNYQKYLEPCLEILAPSINAFGY